MGNIVLRLRGKKRETIAIGGTQKRSVPSFLAEAAMTEVYTGLAWKQDYKILEN